MTQDKDLKPIVDVLKDIDLNNAAQQRLTELIEKHGPFNLVANVLTGLNSTLDKLMLIPPQALLRAAYEARKRYDATGDEIALATVGILVNTYNFLLEMKKFADKTIEDSPDIKSKIEDPWYPTGARGT